MEKLTLFVFILYLGVFALASSDSLPNLCLDWYNQQCVGGHAALLTNGLWLNYSSNSTDYEGEEEQSYSCLVWIDFNSSVPVLEYYEGNDPRNITGVKYVVEQPEHGGGGCLCVNISFPTDCRLSNESMQYR